MSQPYSNIPGAPGIGAPPTIPGATGSQGAAPSPFPGPAPTAAPQGYPQGAPAPAPAPAYAPPAAPTAPAYPQGGAPMPGTPASPAYAPQAPSPAPTPAAAFNPANIGAAIAGATLGVTRYPRLGLGEYILKIELTKKPQNSVALVAEFEIVETTSMDRHVGQRCSFYQDLSGGTQRKAAAQNGAALSFILRAMGFATLEEAYAAGYTQESLGQFVSACIGEGPGPLAGRYVRVLVTDSGKRTKPKQDGTGGGEMIVNYSWSPYR